MIFPMPPKIVISLPVAMLDPRKRPNRAARRRNIYGKHGQKALREWGLE